MSLADTCNHCWGIPTRPGNPAREKLEIDEYSLRCGMVMRAWRSALGSGARTLRFENTGDHEDQFAGGGSDGQRRARPAHLPT